MAKIMERFWTADKGSNFIDWMILTAGLVMLSVALVAAFGAGQDTIATDQLLAASGIVGV